jgi:hypothetical protein
MADLESIFSRELAGAARSSRVEPDQGLPRLHYRNDGPAVYLEETRNDWRVSGFGAGPGPRAVRPARPRPRGRRCRLGNQRRVSAPPRKISWDLGKIPGTRAPGQRCGPSLEARLPDNAAVRPRVEEGSGHGGAGDGKSAGDLAGDQVGVGGQALVSLVIRHALIGARKGVECGEEFGNRCGPRL